jgi:hypothetical protein
LHGEARIATSRNSNNSSHYVKYCSQQVRNHQTLRYHMNRFHAKECIKCTILMCNTFFKTVQEQEKHISNVHNKNKKGSFCVFCNKFLLNWKSAWSHMRSHSTKTPFGAPIDFVHRFLRPVMSSNCTSNKFTNKKISICSACTVVSGFQKTTLYSMWV